MSKAKNTKPLPLAASLRDLALLRASDLDLDTVVPAKSDGERDVVVENSYQFAQQARLALAMHTRGEADVQGERVESIRSSLEELVNSLQS